VAINNIEEVDYTWVYEVERFDILLMKNIQGSRIIRLKLYDIGKNESRME